MSTKAHITCPHCGLDQIRDFAAVNFGEGLPCSACGHDLEITQEFLDNITTVHAHIVAEQFFNIVKK